MHEGLNLQRTTQRMTVPQKPQEPSVLMCTFRFVISPYIGILRNTPTRPENVLIVYYVGKKEHSTLPRPNSEIRHRKSSERMTRDLVQSGGEFTAGFFG